MVQYTFSIGPLCALWFYLGINIVIVCLLGNFFISCVSNNLCCWLNCIKYTNMVWYTVLYCTILYYIELFLYWVLLYYMIINYITYNYTILLYVNGFYCNIVSPKQVKYEILSKPKYIKPIKILTITLSLYSCFHTSMNTK